MRGSYTRVYAEIPRANLTPHLASGGLNYTYRNLSFNGSWNWSDNQFTNLAGTAYRRHRTNIDAGASWRFNPAYSVSVGVRNLFDTPFLNLQNFASGQTALTRHETIGRSWTFAIKGVY